MHTGARYIMFCTKEGCNNEAIYEGHYTQSMAIARRAGWFVEDMTGLPFEERMAREPIILCPDHAGFAAIEEVSYQWMKTQTHRSDQVTIQDLIWLLQNTSRKLRRLIHRGT